MEGEKRQHQVVVSTIMNVTLMQKRGGIAGGVECPCEVCNYQWKIYQLGCIFFHIAF